MMNDETFESICSHLESDQPVKIKTVSGSKFQCKFVRYEHGGLTASIIVETAEGQTLCLTANQLDRIYPCDDDDTHDTFPPISVEMKEES